MKHVLLWFIDGLGLGADNDNNPLVSAEMPTLRRLLGGKPLTASLGRFHSDFASLVPVDASLGIPGIPQSATGQTALFTGVNAPAIEGCHISAFPTIKLREVLAQHSVMKELKEQSRSVTSANFYTPNYFQLVEGRRRRHSASTLTILAAGIPLRQDLRQLEQGEAVYQDLTRAMLAERGFSVELISPRTAGIHLASIVKEHDFTLFEYFQTDVAGHSRNRERAIQVLQQLDQAIGGLLGSIEMKKTLVLITSDHGNIEDVASKPHTRNPVPLLAIGAGHAEFVAGVRYLTDIARAILDVWQENKP